LIIPEKTQLSIKISTAPEWDVIQQLPPDGANQPLDERMR
jgi:hypothetical protein